MLLCDEVDKAAGLLALRFKEPLDEAPGRPTGDANEIVVWDGRDAAILAAATGVNVTLSKLGNESVDDRVLGLLISSCGEAPSINVFGSSFDRWCWSCWACCCCCCRSCREDDPLLLSGVDDVDDDEVGINEMAGPTPKLLASSSMGFLLNCSNASLSSWSRDFFDEEDDEPPTALADSA